MTVKVSRALDVATVLVLLLAVWLIAQPQSALRQQLSGRFSKWQQERQLDEHWPRLQELAHPISQGEVKLVEALDYECSFCRLFQASVDSVLATGVNVAILHRPLPTNPAAKGAARAAICASRQGRFRAMHSRLLTTDTWRTDSNWVREAEAARLDTSTFSKCLTDPAVGAELLRHTQLSDSLRIRGTPTFVTRGRVLQEAPSARALAQMVHQ